MSVLAQTLADYTTLSSLFLPAYLELKQPNPKKQYPVILRRDLVDIQKDKKFEGVYWIKIPVYPNSINIRIQTSCKHDLTEYSIRESKILRIRNEWYIFITIEKQDEPIIPADNVLAVDLGCKNIRDFCREEFCERERPNRPSQ
jgi:transposase